MKTTIVILISIIIFPITSIAQRNLGNFSFGTLHQVHTQFTTKEYKMFVIIFKVIPSKKHHNIESFHLSLPKGAQLEVQKTSIEKSGTNALLIAEVRKYEKNHKKQFETINATLTTTVTGVANNQPIIHNTDIPFSFDLLYR